MKPYLFKTPYLVKRFFSTLLWEMEKEKQGVYLTFDDGPTPEVTPYVLDLLDTYDAKATFFCIGKNIQTHPEIFKDIVKRGHSIGNHTFNHLNASKTDQDTYLKEVQKTETVIRELRDQSPPERSKLFRPPYGRMNTALSKALIKEEYRIVMWSLLSADFDPELNTEKSLRNLKTHSREGSIIVFHDSMKAYQNLKALLPGYLEFLKKEKLEMKGL
ncbi:polysaccharide deacetylase family protein [Robertkochia sediminum]|uniref:polysaccharide deacetylase family protein n=1 Tax=Robertkochia sediminum TaxID=2785326 RepID=UPI0019338C6A|nr:polysaccharide deacetylase family protein [Robertkochia sediminum]MBL7473909.1 polysaccharide deacetylase family protein [Robertkochia sediminum]